MKFCLPQSKINSEQKKMRKVCFPNFLHIIVLMLSAVSCFKSRIDVVSTHDSPGRFALFQRLKSCSTNPIGLRAAVSQLRPTETKHVTHIVGLIEWPKLVNALHVNLQLDHDTAFQVDRTGCFRGNILYLYSGGTGFESPSGHSLSCLILCLAGIIVYIEIPHVGLFPYPFA